MEEYRAKKSKDSKLAAACKFLRAHENQAFTPNLWSLQVGKIREDDDDLGTADFHQVSWRPSPLPRRLVPSVDLT